MKCVTLIWYVARCSCSDGIPAGAPQRSMAHLLFHARCGCGNSSDHTREEAWWRASVHSMINQAQNTRLAPGFGLFTSHIDYIPITWISILMALVSVFFNNAYVIDLGQGAPGESVLKHSTAAPSPLIDTSTRKRKYTTTSRTSPEDSLL